jgi:L-ascorbate metabolism protein UlaG (beta-lactamase superfamily)
VDELTFVGTATTILQIGSFTLLTDPNFLHKGQRAYLGKGLWSRRLTEPALQPAQLPRLDAIILSHLHGDHFDRIARQELSREPPVLTTPEAARRLGRWGFDAAGLRPWEKSVLTKGEETLTVESVPAVHARGMLGRLLPPVMGSVLEHAVDGAVRQRIYISGDTLTGPHLRSIAERHPEIATALVHLGGTRVLFHTVTMDAAQGIELLRTVRPDQAVPIHFDDYRVFKDPLSRFLAAASHAGTASQITPVDRGSTIELPSLTSRPGRIDERTQR